MAGKLVVDTIDTDNAFITLNVQQSQIATMNVSGIYSNTGVKMIGANGTVSNTAITGLVTASQIANVANTQITGNITAAQITSVANTQITGNITAAQITSVANTQLTGLIQAAQIGSANATLITSGTLPGARLPAGSVLQVVNATRAGATVSTTSTSDVSFGATASITPTSSSSKIYIIASGGWYLAVGTATEYAISIQRNGATIPTGGNDGLTCVYGSGQLGGSYVITILDTPATTSSTTYLVVAHNINSGTSSLANGVRATQLNEITLMEIAA